MAKRPYVANYGGNSKWTTPPSDEQYKKNFDAIFGKKCKKCGKPVKDCKNAIQKRKAT